jgi:hypothetical protein
MTYFLEKLIALLYFPNFPEIHCKTDMEKIKREISCSKY